MTAGHARTIRGVFARLVAVAAGSAVTLMAQQFVELRDRHLQRYATDRLEAVDGDGDGDLDLLARDGALHENDGHGVFALHLPGTRIPLVPGGSGYRVRDVDGDGRPDLIAAVGIARVVRHGVAAGVFEATGHTMPAEGSDGADFDADGDGDLDVYAFRRLWRNDGRSTWIDASAGLPTTSYVYGRGSHAQDFDGDGDLDLFIDGTRLWENLGGLTFRERLDGFPFPLLWTAGLRIADTNGDGLPDLLMQALVSSTIGMHHWQNNGSLAFVEVAARTLPEEFDSRALLSAIAADADGDGAADLWWPGFGLFRNDGSGAFSLDASVSAPLGIGIPADLDGDRDLDFVLESDRVLFNDGHSRLSENRFPATLTDPYQPSEAAFVRVADLDGDGDLDVAGWWHGIGFNDGNGSLVPVHPSRMPSPPFGLRVLAVADVNGDRNPDLLLHADWVKLWISDGAGGYRDASSLLPPTRFPLSFGRSMISGDVDGDGDVDLVKNSDLSYQNQLEILRNDGAAGFSQHTFRMMVWSGIVKPVALADLDSDGDPDLLVNPWVEGNGVLLNDGRGAFTTMVPGDIPGDAAVCVDYDGDGDLDAVTTLNPWPGDAAEFRVLVNDGRGGLRARTLVTASPGITLDEFWLADVDCDGDLDLGGARGPDGPSYFANDGAWNFTLAPGVRSDGIAVRGRVADLDGDGDPDFVDATRIALNRHRQIEAPWVARIGHPFRLESNSAPGYGSGPRAMAILLGTAMLPRPVSLGSLGVLRIDLASAHAIGPSPLPAGGRTLLDLMIPRDPALVGETLVAQGLVLDGLLPSEWRLTGAAVRTIHR